MLGTTLSLSESALAQLAQVTPVDLAAARQTWSQRVPLRWKRLLESPPVGSLPDGPPTPFVWDAQSRRYIEVRTRLYVPFTTIREQAVEPLIRGAETAQRALVTQAQTGDLSLGDWQRGMMDEIKRTQLAAALAANGGEQNSNQSDYEAIAALILILLLLLQNFARDLQAGKQALNGFFRLRSDLYARAARATFEEIHRRAMLIYLGAVQEKRELGKAEHCRTNREREGCVELHDLGWQPIGTLPKIGDTPCRTNCKCRFIFRYQNDAGEWITLDDSPTAADILRRFPR